MNEEARTLLNELRKNSKTGIKFVKNFIKNQEGISFDDFSREKRDKSFFSRCTANDNNTRIFFHCKECCKSPSSIMCLKCYLNGNHQEHHVKIIATDKSVCDCGDDSSINPDGWCSEHKKSENIILSSQEYLTLFSGSLALLTHISENMEEKHTKKCMKSLFLLKEICKWGSTYIDVISKALFDGGWDNSPFKKIIKQWKIASPKLSEEINSLFFELVTSTEFTSGYARCSPDALIEASLFFESSDFLLESTDFLLLSSQCYSDSDALCQINKETRLFLRLVHASTHILSLLFKEDNAGKIRFSNFRFPEGKIITHIFDRFLEPVFAMLRNQRFIIESIKDSESLQALTQFITFASNITPVTRKVGDKEEYNSFDYYNSYAIFSSFIFPIIELSRGISCLYSNVSKDQSDSWEAPHSPLTHEQIDTLKSMIRNVLINISKLPTITSQSIVFGKETNFIDPFTSEFYPFEKSSILYGSAILYTALHNHIPASLLQLTDEDVSNMETKLCSVIGGMHMAQCGLFSRNDDTIPEVLGYLTTISHYLGAAQAFAATTINPGQFLTKIAESFGLSHWMNSDESSDELTQCIAFLLRFIIQIGSDTTFASYSEKRLKQTALIHFIKSGFQTRDELLSKTSAFLGNYDLDELLEEITIHTRVDGITHFKLLPEYDSQAFLFSFFLEIPDYLKVFPSLSKSIQFPENVPPSQELSNISQLFTSKEMELLIRSIITTAKNERKRSQHLVYNLLCLLFLIMKYKNAEWVIEGDTCSIICSVFDMVSSESDQRQFAKDFISNFDQLTILNRYLISEHCASLPKVTIDTVRKTIQNNCSFDETSSSSDLSENEDDNFKCSFCQNQIKQGQDFGILASFFETDILDYASRILNETDDVVFPPFLQLRTCGHYCHNSCYQAFLNSNGTTPICPYDRTLSNIIIPISNVSDHVKEIEDIFSQNSIIGIRQTTLQNISLFELLTRTNPSRIQDSNINKLLQYMLELSIYSSDEESISVDPFINFGVSILAKKDKAIPEFGTSLKPFLNEVISSNVNCLSIFIRRCELLFNLLIKKEIKEYASNESFAKSFGLSLPAGEVSIPRSLHFPKLHKSFIDFFTEEDKVPYLNSSEYDVGQCLLCGDIFYIVPPHRSAIPSSIGIMGMIEHINRCCCGRTVPILFLTGNIATAVDVFDKDHPLRYSFGSIYSDKFGDYDEGLRRGSVLSLDNERESKLVEILLDGTLKRYVEQRMPDSLEELQTVEARARFIAEM